MRRSSRSDLTSPVRRLGWGVAAALALVLPTLLAVFALNTWPPLLWGVAVMGAWPAFFALGVTSSARDNRWRRAWLWSVGLGGVGYLPATLLAPEFGVALGVFLPFVTALALGSAPLALPAMLVERQVTDRPRTPVHAFGLLLSIIIALGLPVFSFGLFSTVERGEVFFLMALAPALILAVLLTTWRPTRVRGTGPILDSGAWLGQAWIRRPDGIHWVSASEEREQRPNFRAIGIRPEMAGFSVDVPATEQPLPLLRLAGMALLLAFLPLMSWWLVTVPGSLYTVVNGTNQDQLTTWLFAHHVPLILAALMATGFAPTLGAVWAPFLVLKASVARNSGGPLRLDGRTVRTADGVFHLGQKGEHIQVRTGLRGTALVMRNLRQKLVLRGAAPELHGIRQALLNVEERGEEESIPVEMQHLHAEVRAGAAPRDTSGHRE